MKTIWKFPLAAQLTVIEVPAGSQFLHAGMQAKVPGPAPLGETPTLWYLVDPAEPKEQKSIVILGTGDHLHARDGSLEHLGTVLTSGGGALVWHIFENKAGGG